jgi:hypothetical protein
LLVHSGPPAQDETGASSVSPDIGLVADMNILSRLPEVSARNREMELERSRNYELGYRRRFHSRALAISAFGEQVSDSRISVAGDLAGLDPADLLSDGVSKTSVLNIGGFTRVGYLASVSQSLSQSLDLAVAYGRMGGFSASPGSGESAWESGGRMLSRANPQFASIQINAKAPVTATRMSASYGWVEGDALIPTHVFTTQNAAAQPGLNLFIRQPLPSLFGIPGHVELTADLRNLLAQGYIPMVGAGGSQFLVVQNPRAIRGGLSFIF